MSVEKIGAIILAAGSSSRLGEPKQFLRYRGETLIRRAARAALTAGCSPVVVVAGAAHERIERELAELEVQVHHHAQWPRGIGSSIRAGVEHALLLQPSLEALVLMVCDQPRVTAEVLTALIRAHADSQHPAAASAYAGTLGVPAIFARAHFQKLAALPDDDGAKHLLRALPDLITRVPFPEGSIDIDTPADSRLHLATPMPWVHDTPQSRLTPDCAAPARGPTGGRSSRSG